MGVASNLDQSMVDSQAVVTCKLQLFRQLQTLLLLVVDSIVQLPLTVIQTTHLNLSPVQVLVELLVALVQCKTKRKPSNHHQNCQAKQCISHPRIIIILDNNCYCITLVSLYIERLRVCATWPKAHENHHLSNAS